jgi:hypothetical protein
MAEAQKQSFALDLAEVFEAFDPIVPELEIPFLERHMKRLERITRGFEGSCDKFNRILTFGEPATASPASEYAFEVRKSIGEIEPKIDIATNASAELQGQVDKFADATLAQPDAFLAGDVLGSRGFST